MTEGFHIGYRWDVADPKCFTFEPGWRGPGWHTLKATITRVNGRWELTELTISGTAPILTSELRAISPKDIVNRWRASEAALEGLARVGHELPAPLPEEWVSEVLKRSESVNSPKPRRGRPAKYGLEHFEAVADVYTQAQIDHRTPTMAVAKHWHVSASTAAKWVWRARHEHDGLLPETTIGKANAVAPEQPKTKPKKGRNS